MERKLKIPEKTAPMPTNGFARAKPLQEETQNHERLELVRKAVLKSKDERVDGAKDIVAMVKETPDDVKHIAALLSDPNDWLVAHIARAIYDLPRNGIDISCTLEPLKNAYHRDSNVVKQRVITALYYAQNHGYDISAAVPEFLAAIVHDHSLVRTNAAYAMGRMAAEDMALIGTLLGKIRTDALIYEDGIWMRLDSVPLALTEAARLGSPETRKTIVSEILDALDSPMFSILTGANSGNYVHTLGQFAGVLDWVRKVESRQK